MPHIFSPSIWKHLWCGWMGPIHPPLACWSTAAGKCTVRPDEAPNSHWVLTLRSDDLDLHCAASQDLHLLLHPTGNASIHAGSTRQHSISTQFVQDVNITLHDGVEGGPLDVTGFHTQEGRLEVTSGHQKHSLLMVITSQLFSQEQEDGVIATFCSSSRAA